MEYTTTSVRPARSSSVAVSDGRTDGGRAPSGERPSAIGRTAGGRMSALARSRDSFVRSVGRTDGRPPAARSSQQQLARTKTLNQPALDGRRRQLEPDVCSCQMESGEVRTAPTPPPRPPSLSPATASDRPTDRRRRGPMTTAAPPLPGISSKFFLRVAPSRFLERAT